MRISKAKELLRKPIDRMGLEELQAHKVRLIDAWRESRAENGMEQAVRNGFYKVIASESASGFSPTDIWLSHNLIARFDEVVAREQEMLRST